ncbi:MAG: penicillin-binding protein activator LpoB [Desulfobulbaceae bacterium]|nr:penicillin-binding protein activator LpoB [Desulfobulbaceae bacterium]
MAKNTKKIALSPERYRGLISAAIGALLSLCLVVLNGCGARFPELQQLAPLPSKPPCHIAVLPFVNKSKYVQADRIVYKIFMAELLQSTQYRVAQEGDVRKIYRQLKIYPQQTPQFDQLKIMADRLNTQFFIIGTILKAQEQTSGRAANPQLTMMLDLVDATSGKTLWSTYHTREGIQYQKVMHFGLVTTISGVARRMSQEILNLWFREGLQPCTE